MDAADGAADAACSVQIGEDSAEVHVALASTLVQLSPIDLFMPFASAHCLVKLAGTLPSGPHTKLRHPC